MATSGGVKPSLAAGLAVFLMHRDSARIVRSPDATLAATPAVKFGNRTVVCSAWTGRHSITRQVGRPARTAANLAAAASDSATAAGELSGTAPSHGAELDGAGAIYQPQAFTMILHGATVAKHMPARAMAESFAKMWNDATPQPVGIVPLSRNVNSRQFRLIHQSAVGNRAMLLVGAEHGRSVCLGFVQAGTEIHRVAESTSRPAAT